MLYTELTKKAMAIAFEVHKDQVDKTGLPYIYHPIHLAEQMDDEAACCVALLHDTVEDGDITFDYLEAQGFTEEIVAAVRLMTHDDAVPYMDYVAALRPNPIARKVKLADLRHNSDLSRWGRVDEKILARAEKYKAAMALLETPQPGEGVLELITEMENRLNTLRAALDAGESIPEEEMTLLMDYYGSEDWFCHRDLDSRGLLPSDLSRGVLTEDLVYDLYTDWRQTK